jgi:hypothetical protein
MRCYSLLSVYRLGHDANDDDDVISLLLSKGEKLRDHLAIAHLASSKVWNSYALFIINDMTFL